MYPRTALLLSLTTVVFCLPSGTVSTARADDGRLAPEDFAILPWGWTRGDDSALKEIHACGFNLAGFVAPQHVDLVEKAGLQCIVSDKRIRDGVSQRIDDEKVIARRVKAATKSLRDHPAAFGWYLRDEPDAPYFDVLAKWCDAFRKAAPDQLRYINLFPIYVNCPAIGVENYEQYVNQFVSKCEPEFISYDNYSLMADGTLRPGYFKNLEIIRAAALKNDVPFWNLSLIHI